MTARNAQTGSQTFALVCLIRQRLLRLFIAQSTQNHGRSRTTRIFSAFEGGGGGIGGGFNPRDGSHFVRWADRFEAGARSPLGRGAAHRTARPDPLYQRG